MESLEDAFYTLLPELANRRPYLSLLVITDGDQAISRRGPEHTKWIFDPERELLHRYVHIIVVFRENSVYDGILLAPENKEWVTVIRTNGSENQVTDYTINFILTGFLKEWEFRNNSSLNVGILTMDKFPLSLMPLFENTSFSVKQIDPRSQELSFYIINSLGDLPGVLMPPRLYSIFNIIKSNAGLLIQNCVCGTRGTTILRVQTGTGRRPVLCGPCENVMTQLHSVIPRELLRTMRTQLIMSEIERYRNEQDLKLEITNLNIASENSNLQWILLSSLVNDKIKAYYLPSSTVDNLLKLIVSDESMASLANYIKTVRETLMTNVGQRGYKAMTDIMKAELKQKNFMRTLIHPVSEIIFSSVGDESKYYYETPEERIKRLVEDPNELYIRLYYRTWNNTSNMFAKSYSINKASFATWLNRNVDDIASRSALRKYAQSLTFYPDDEYYVVETMKNQ